MKQEAKRERIEAYKKKYIILNVEKAWEKFAMLRVEKDEDVAFEFILHNESIGKLIRIIKNSYYKAWKNSSRLTLEDFESVIYEKAWMIIGTYSWSSNYYLYEQLNKGIKDACIDLLREQQLTKNRKEKNNSLFHKATSFTQEDNFEKDLISPINIENTLIMKEWIEQALQGKELAVAKLLLLENDLILDEICEELGLKHREQVRRILKRIKVAYLKD